MNNHGGMRLSAAGGSHTFQIVDYATDELRRALADVVAGETIDLRLVGLGSRGHGWRVVAIVSTVRSDRACCQPVSVWD